MSPPSLIVQELSAAKQAWHDGNEGKARVCARRAVAVATESWSASRGEPQGQADAMAHLRRIQQQGTFPLPVRQAAERLTTAVTRRQQAPFTTDPVSDASLIISHLAADTSSERPSFGRTPGVAIPESGAEACGERHRMLVVLIMGVSGAGKTTVGRHLAEVLGWRFVEGDDLHPAANIEKMRSGHPLTDADRRPWLERLHAALVDQVRMNQPAVMACSVLKATYRTIVEEGCGHCVRLVYLKGRADVIRQRLAGRREHFMPPELLDSQLAILEEPADALVVDATLPPDEIILRIRQGLAR
ncbi:MAG TPA: gluconokinase [Nitrospira sp.]|nr:gluconokinase [Nitrospira sp.]HQR15014.1 gluconokinase [Nitrospira sp.]HQV11306.1 gluconokinase [Nitrospira sp.]